MLIERLERVALLGSAWVLYVMMALSVLSISVMIERLVFFAKHRGDADALGDRLIERLHADDRAGAERVLKESALVEAAVVRRALPWMDGGPASLAEALEAEMGRKRKELERGMTFLGTLGNNAPFIGLFGTVLGVIQAFHMLGDRRPNKAAMGNVMVRHRRGAHRHGRRALRRHPRGRRVQRLSRRGSARSRATSRRSASISSRCSGTTAGSPRGAAARRGGRPRRARGRRQGKGSGAGRAGRRRPRDGGVTWPAPCNRGGGRGRAPIVGINVTPMVDVVLVLLVIMMVSATYIVSQSLKVELPKTASTDESVASIAAVTVTKGGGLYFNQEPVTERALVAKLKEAVGKNPEINLIVSGDATPPMATSCTSSISPRSRGSPSSPSTSRPRTDPCAGGPPQPSP